jgi:hypothetical protein
MRLEKIHSSTDGLVSFVYFHFEMNMNTMNLIDSLCDSLDGGSVRRKTPTYTGQHKQTKTYISTPREEYEHRFLVFQLAKIFCCDRLKECLPNTILGYGKINIHALKNQNTGRNHDIKIANKCFENVTQFRYLGISNKSKLDTGGN